MTVAAALQAGVAGTTTTAPSQVPAQFPHIMSGRVSLSVSNVSILHLAAMVPARLISRVRYCEGAVSRTFSHFTVPEYAFGPIVLRIFFGIHTLAHSQFGLVAQ